VVSTTPALSCAGRVMRIDCYAERVRAATGMLLTTARP